MSKQASKSIERKYEALNAFVEKLLQSEAAPYVAKITLFGSLSEGEAEEESDVDVLVLSIDGQEKLEKVCAEIAFEVALSYGESVEPLVYPVSEWFSPSSYFLHRALQGQEVYSMDEELIRRKEAEAALSLAGEYLLGAKSAFQAKHYRLAIDAAYNAAELCVKALLLTKLEKLPRTHGGLVREFGKQFVLTGEVSRDWGAFLSEALSLRNKARYDYHAYIGEEHAEKVISLAEEFINLAGQKVA